MTKKADTHSGGADTAIVIVAAGSGSRFGSAVPKQWLPLKGVPALLHTVAAMHDALPAARIVLVLSADGEERLATLRKSYDIPDCTVVRGGASRSESVANALKAIMSGTDTRDFILIHDGARPLVHPDVVRAVHGKLSRTDAVAVVPVLPLTEAIGAVDNDGIVPVARDGFRTVQTPQGFRTTALAEAYRKADGEVLADDAAIIARYGAADIATVPGHSQNIKITNPTDLAVAEVLMANPLPYTTD